MQFCFNLNPGSVSAISDEFDTNLGLRPALNPCGATIPLAAGPLELTPVANSLWFNLRNL